MSDFQMQQQQMQQQMKEEQEQEERMKEEQSMDVLPTEVMARIDRLGLVGALTLYDDIVAEEKQVKKRYHVTARTKAYLGVKDTKERNKRLLRVMTDRWALVQVLSTPYRMVHLLHYIRELLYVAACWEAIIQKA